MKLPNPVIRTFIRDNDTTVQLRGQCTAKDDLHLNATVKSVITIEISSSIFPTWNLLKHAYDEIMDFQKCGLRPPTLWGSIFP
jgi:hypothetical protein